MSEWKYAVVDLSDNSTTVLSTPALLKGVYINTVLSNHVCPIKDNTTSVITLVAQLDAGTLLEFADPVRFETSLVVDPDDSATGSITLMYNPLR